MCHTNKCAVICVRFTRLFVGVASALEIVKQVGTKLSAVDACWFKHFVYQTGQIHMISTLDGNKKVVPLAWAICETESRNTWEYFRDQCILFGLEDYINLPDSVVFSDRMKGIEAFMAHFNAWHLLCYKHVRNNIYAHSGRSKPSSQLLWDLQKASSYDSWQQLLEKIEDVSTAAANYIGTLPKIVWRYYQLQVCFRYIRHS